MFCITKIEMIRHVLYIQVFLRKNLIIVGSTFRKRLKSTLLMEYPFSIGKIIKNAKLNSLLQVVDSQECKVFGYIKDIITTGKIFQYLAFIQFP